MRHFRLFSNAVADEQIRERLPLKAILLVWHNSFSSSISLEEEFETFPHTVSLLVFQAWFWLSWENRKATSQTDHCHQFLWYTWGFFGALASACIIFDKQSKTEVAQSVRLSTNVFTHGCLLGGFGWPGSSSWSAWDPIWHRKYTNHVTQDDPLFKVQVLLEFLLNRKFLNSYYRQIPLRVP